MSIWSDWLLPRLMDSAVLSTVFLALMLALRVAVRRPGARVTVGWGAMLGLLVLTVAPWLLPRLSIVPQGSTRMDGRSTATKVEAAPVRAATHGQSTKLAASEPAPAPQATVALPAPTKLVTPAGTAKLPPLAATKTEQTSSHAAVAVADRAFGATPTWLSVSPLNIAAIIWLLAAGTTCGWIVVGGWRVRGILSHAVPAPQWMTEQLRELDRTCASRSRRLAGIKLSGDVVTAVAMNAWAPCILLPAEGAHLTDRQLARLALAHEAAHIRQGDLWLLALERTLLPIYFLQPLFWIWRWLLRGDQELLADAAASADDPVAYADALVAWARSATDKLTRSRSPFNTLHALSLFDNRPPLTRRIDMLLDPTVPRPRPVSRRTALVAACAFLTMAGGLSVFSLQPAAAQPAAGAASETAAPTSAAPASAAQAEAAKADAARAEAARQAETAARTVAEAGKQGGTSDATEAMRLHELELRTATLELQRAEERYRTYLNGRSGDTETAAARSARSARDNAALAVERAKLAVASASFADVEQLAIEEKLLELDLREAQLDLELLEGTQKRRNAQDEKGILPLSDKDRENSLTQLAKARIAVERAKLKLDAHKAQRRAAAAAQVRAASRPPMADAPAEDARVGNAPAVEEGLSKAAEALQGYWEKKSHNGVNSSMRSLVYLDRSTWSTVPLRNNERHPQLRIKLNETRNPVEIDLSIENSTTRGLLKLDGDELTLCLGAQNAPRPSAFKFGANPFPQLLVYRRAKTEDARIISRVGTFSASVLILNDGRAIAVTPETKFVRKTKDGEQAMSAEDLRDDDVVIFDSHQLADTFVRRIVVMKEADLPASPVGEFSVDLIDALRSKGLEWCVSLMPRSDSRSDRAGGGASVPRMSGGGGVFVDDRGYILAPLGSVDSASSLIVLTGNANGGANPFSGFGSGGFNNPVTFLARDPKQNLALLQVTNSDRRGDPRHGSVRWAEKPAAVGETVLPVSTNNGRSAAGSRITPLKVVAVDREALVNGVMLRGLIELEPSAALSGSLLLNANSEAVGFVMNATDVNPAPIFAMPAAAAGKFVQEALQTAKSE